MSYLNKMGRRRVYKTASNLVKMLGYGLGKRNMCTTPVMFIGGLATTGSTMTTTTATTDISYSKL
jgi:hypothetical protein